MFAGGTLSARPRCLRRGFNGVSTRCTAAPSRCMDLAEQRPGPNGPGRSLHSSSRNLFRSEMEEGSLFKANAMKRVRVSYA